MEFWVSFCDFQVNNAFFKDIFVGFLNDNIQGPCMIWVIIQ